MTIELTMPRLSDTMEQGTIIKWNVKEGDAVAAGDVVADIETDKATMEMQVYDDGTVGRIVVGEGQTVEVGTVIAIVAEEGEDLQEVSAAVAPSAPRAETAEATPAVSPCDEVEAVSGEVTAPPAQTPPPVPPRGDGRVRMSPVARRLAAEHGVDVSTLQGSGPAGRIVKGDVLRAVEASRETAAAIPPSARAGLVATPVPLATSPVLEDRSIALSSMRQTIATRLVEAKTTIPHYQVTVSFNMDPLLGLRRTLNEQLADQGVKLSVNDFLVRGCALGMHQHPQLNSSWGGDHVRIHGNVNIGLAIALPPERSRHVWCGALHGDHQPAQQRDPRGRRRPGEAGRARGRADGGP
ncbi:MAG: dihydrolipoamide acetyltransferase family protein [Planctomycetota bacterium]|jgi:pyruvate dehydrogenase E2 component (dihydrolipoamide acetyltransferase)